MRRLHQALAVVLTVALSNCATLPRAGRPALPDVQFKLRDFPRANGLRVLVEEDHASPLVGIYTVVNVGSAGDPVGKEGLAHLVEHLLFRSKHDGRITLWDRLEYTGVSTLNAWTEFDATVYHEVFPREMLPTMLATEGARFTQMLANIDQSVLDVEREVVKNEERQRGEMQVGPEFAWLQQAVFPPSHPYSRPIAGTKASIDAITLDDVKAFVGKHYKPENYTMLIIGDVDLATVDSVLDRALPKALYGLPRDAAAAKPTPRLPPQGQEPPPPPSGTLVKKEAAVATPELYLAWSLPRSYDNDALVQDFVELSAQQELAEAWRDDEDIVTVNISRFSGIEAGVLMAQVVLRKASHPEKTIERVLNNLVKTWTSGEAGREYAGTQEEMAREAQFAFGRLRNRAVVEMTLAAEDIGNRGAERITTTHFTGDPLVYSRRLKTLGDIGPSQVEKFASKYLTRERARAVLVNPLPANAKARGAAGLADPLTASEAVKVKFPVSQLKELDRQKQADGAVTTQLPNGLKLVVLPRRGLPVATVRLVMPIGKAVAVPFGAADFAQDIGRPRSRLHGTAADFGIGVQDRYTADAHSVVLRGANGNVPNMMAILYDRVTSMYVEPGSAGEAKKEFLDYLASVDALPESRAERAGASALFPDHPYGKTATSADLEKLSDSDIDGWLKRAYAPQGAVLVVVGDVKPEEVQKSALEWLGEWTSRGEPVPAVPRVQTAAHAPVVQVTQRPGSSQAGVMVACQAPGNSLKDAAVQSIIAETLGSHLNRTLREEMGATYGVHGSSAVTAGGVGEVSVSGLIENDRLGKALKVLKTSWDGFGEQLTEEKIGRARWQMARYATLRGTTSGSLANAMANAVMLGREAKSIDDTISTLAQVKEADLKAAFARCKETAVFSLMGDEDVIKASLKEAGF